MGGEVGKGAGVSPEVVHNTGEGRFELRDGERLAVLEYAIEGNAVVMHHTGVPPELEGRGYGSRLVRTALDYAKGAGLRVVPQCSFVRSYIDRHPDYASLVARDDTSR